MFRLVLLLVGLGLVSCNPNDEVVLDSRGKPLPTGFTSLQSSSAPPPPSKGMVTFSSSSPSKPEGTVLFSSSNQPQPPSATPVHDQLPLPKYSIEPFIHLIYEFPLLPKPDRMTEYLKALKMNLEHPLVRNIHLFLQDDARQYLQKHLSASERAKIQEVPTSQQILYRDAFTEANRLPAGTLCVVMNADIELGAGWDKLNGNKLDRTAFALSRYQRQDCGKLETFCFGDGSSRDKGDYKPFRNLGGTSHDSFVFTTPVPARVISFTDFKQNEWTAENHVIWAFRKSKYKVRNPCLTLQTWHEHCSEFRTYNQKTTLDWNKRGNARPCVL